MGTILLLTAPAARPDPAPVAAGALVVHGGGRGSDAARARALALAGGPAARVLVVPYAAADPVRAGADLMTLWRRAGVRAVEGLDLIDRDRAIAQVERADLIWITSGDQNRLMAALAGTGVPEATRRRHRAGAVVGGTSAGAAAMSAVMITGEAPDPRTGSTRTAEGLGLWPGVIVDQHVLRRDRVGRLRRAVLDRPALVGVGLDEGAFAVVRGRRFEIGGDARAAAVVIDARGGPEPRVATLRPGDSFGLDPGPAAP